MIILKAENISKQYRLGNVGTGTLSHDLNRFWHKLRGKEDPYLKVGAVNDRSSKAKEEYVWALRDINFEVQEGEVLGIIGKNGAGKSTLLKILSRVTSPTTGVIKTKGRIASLLEVGTGFHPELTGRENIYLNGAILGMTRAEITAKLDEIVEFSGCELYIDTPVKRYSSGMTVRLAFAVAAHLEPDILVVDEVLAVGDAEFQKKAIGKMQDISKGEGRTVLFVSHNMASIKQLCTRAIVLVNGKCGKEGNVEECLDFYLENHNTFEVNSTAKRKGMREIIVEDINFIVPGNHLFPVTGKPLIIEFRLKKNIQREFRALRLDFKVEDIFGKRIAWFSSALDLNSDNDFDKSGKICFYFAKWQLIWGKYVISYNLLNGMEIHEEVSDFIVFEVLDGYYYKSSIKITPAHTPILLDYTVKSNSIFTREV